MATISKQQQQSSPSPPSVPSPQALASRGRRPALIPHNADLSLSLSAAATALGMASYSPNRARGTSGNSGSLLWVLPSSSPPTAAWSGDSLETRWKEDGQMCDIDLDDDQREAVRSLVVKDVFSWVCALIGELVGHTVDIIDR
ncbi:hypothetical protein P167DRAFT_537581 [Morchella conica CCBAS932]|uniref:Uncharacterized protein n=1 Tax=Morchella conica CCBAS932 TaxID=1392247 RepID=A0A3N4KPV1_9PEZI|nr:hypothetical protein P167DRAFT_537581 [Morchella conica CCBAS932]